MTRRFELGPILVAVASLVLLVSLFLDWYGGRAAWDAFELVDVLLAALAVAALAGVVGTLAPDAAYVHRRWLPALAAAATILVAVSVLDPPPAARRLAADTGAWVALGAAIAMLVGAILSLGRVSVSVAVEERDAPERVAAVDHRQPTTESAPVVSARRPGRRGSLAAGEHPTEPTQPTQPPGLAHEG